MNNQWWIWVVAALVILGGGYYLLYGKQTPSGVGGEGNPMENQQVGGEAMPVSPEAQRAVGNWQNADDSKFRREIRADGTVTDTYEGDASATAEGSWSQVIDVSREPIELPAVGGATYLKLVIDGEPLYFAISTDTTADKLVLVNLSGRGNVLTFTRVK